MSSKSLIGLWCIVTTSVYASPDEPTVGEAVDLLRASTNGIYSFDVRMSVTHRWPLKTDVAGSRVVVKKGIKKELPILKPRRLRGNEEAEITLTHYRQLYSDGRRRIDVLDSTSGKPIREFAFDGAEFRALYRTKLEAMIDELPFELVPAGEDYLGYYRMAEGATPLIPFVFGEQTTSRVTRYDDGSIVLESPPDAARNFAPSWGFRVWMDPDHGMMPKQIEKYEARDTDGGEVEVVTRRILVEEFKQIQENVWAPVDIVIQEYRRVEPLLGESMHEAHAVIDEGKSHWNKAIEESNFVLALPPGTRVSDQLRGVAFVVGNPNPEANLKELVRSAREVVPITTEAPTEASSRSWILLAAVFAVTLLVALALLLVRRRGSQKP